MDDEKTQNVLGILLKSNPQVFNKGNIVKNLFDEQENQFQVVLAKCAHDGDVDCQYRLASMYEDGDGVPQNYSEAVKWYTMAAEQGHADSQYKLGEMYHFGYGVDQNEKEAIKWYTMSINAQCN